MLQVSDVQLAADLGVLASTGRAADVLAKIVAYTGATMAQLDSWDGARARPMSVHAVPPEVSRVLSNELPTDGVYGRHLRETAGLCLSDDPPLSFEQSRFHLGLFKPAGVSTGASMALRAATGDISGFLHLATARKERFDDRCRVTLNALEPVLAQAVAPHRMSLIAATIPEHFAAARIEDGTVETIAGHPRATVCTHPDIAELVGRFATSTAPFARFSWPERDGWLEVRLVREVSDGPAVLLACAPRALPWNVTARELEVLTGVVIGSTNRQIAGSLGIAERTVQTHVENIVRKMGVSGRTAAATRALTEGAFLPRLGVTSLRGVTQLLFWAGRRHV